MGVLKVFLYTVVMFYLISYINPVHGNCPEDESTTSTVVTCNTRFELGDNTSGIYLVCPDGQTPFQVYCDMETDGGGWTVFQRRMNGSVNFFRTWADYEEGFGDLNGEFWLGLSKIHRLTQDGTSYTLTVDLEDFENEKRYAKYSTLNIGDSTTDYTITLGGYSGDAGDSMTNSEYSNVRVNGRKFSTFDRDNDQSNSNCAGNYKGGWWYNACHFSNLNGLYLGGPHPSYADGIEWYTWRGHQYSLKFTEMKLKNYFITAPQVSTTTVVPTLATTGQTVDPTSTSIPTPIPTPSPDESSTTVTIPYTPFSINTSVNAPAECPVVPDCKTWFEYGVKTSGVYPINPDGKTPFQVYCDMETDGGGWTVFQRRKDGSVNFLLNWIDYEEGFGDLNGEFWLGLSKIHRLTQDGTDYTLRVDLEDFENETRYAKYSTLNIGDSTTDYTITVEGYSGDAGDSLSIHNGMKFSTMDRDNDIYGNVHCAVEYSGAWWYTSCHHSNLNGLYLGGHHASYANGIEWYHWREFHYSLKFTEMKVKKN